MDVSVIILTWNSAECIETNVQHLISDLESTTQDFEIHIVDNGSKDHTRSCIEDLKKKYSSIIKPIFLPSNLGTTKSRNMALRASKGKYLFLMDSDAYPLPGCSRYLLSTLDYNEKIGIAAPKLIYSDGRYQKSTDVFPTIQYKIFRYFFLKSIEKVETVPPRGPVDYAISAFWAMRRNLLYEVRGFDERIFYSPEDIDFCLRVWKAGYAVYYVSDAIAIHDPAELSRKFTQPYMFFLHAKGLIYYFIKHRYLIKRPEFRSA